MNRLFAMKAAEYSAYVLAGLLATGSVLATFGTLPGALQDPVANALDHLGIDLPGGSDEQHAAAPVERSEGNDAGAGRAFRAPMGDSRYERGGAPSSRRYYDYYEPDYGDYYREYYGVEEEEDDNEVYFLPPEDSGREGYNPGEPGEPGGRGVPNSEGDAPGEADGTPGEPGPAGDPG